MPFRDPLVFDRDLQGDLFFPGNDGWKKIGAIGSPPQESRPRKVTRKGALTRSTSLALETWPSIVWDTNGYYRELGVTFKATKRELAEAYWAKNGMNDARLTYVFKQLLDPEIRRRYDTTPLGSVFMDDYVIAEIQRKAFERSKNLRRMGLSKTPEQVLEEWGLLDPEDSAVDIPKDVREDETGAAAEQEWPYTYFTWGIGTFPLPHELRLAQAWQEALIKECQHRRVVTNFAVGLMDRPREPARSLVMSVSGVTVLFISLKASHEVDELVSHTIDMMNH